LIDNLHTINEFCAAGAETSGFSTCGTANDGALSAAVDVFAYGCAQHSAE
jgi:hypothetical protein